MLWHDDAIWFIQRSASVTFGEVGRALVRVNPDNWSRSSKAITGMGISALTIASAVYHGCVLVAAGRKVYDVVWGSGVTATASELFELDSSVTGTRITALAVYLDRLYVSVSAVVQNAPGSGMTIELIPIDAEDGTELTTGGAERISVERPAVSIDSDHGGRILFTGAGEDGDDLRLGFAGWVQDENGDDQRLATYYRRLPGTLTWTADTEDISGGPDAQWDVEAAAGNWLDEVEESDGFPGIGSHPEDGDAILVRRNANGSQQMWQQSGATAKAWRRGPR